MKCLTPIKIEGEYVPCGHCYACQTNRRNEWDLRLRIEHLHSNNSVFVTLTYAEPFLPFGNIVSYDDHVKFMGNLRSYYRDVRFRYYMVGEYGEKFGRPHLHYLLFYDKDIDIIRAVDDAWPFGFTDVGNITHKSIHYVTKWHINPKYRNCDDSPLENHGFSNMSKGIGRDLIQQFTKDNIQPTYTLNGKRLPVSRYYRKKLCFEVTNVDDLYTYISKKYNLNDVFQIKKQIKRLIKSFEQKQKQPRKSIF